MNIFARYRVSMIKTLWESCTDNTNNNDNDADNDNDDDDANDT